MRQLLMFGSLATCLTGCQAVTSPSSPSVHANVMEDGSAEHPLKLGRLHIEHLPTSSDLANQYPYEAMRHDTAGKARLVCIVKADGHLSECAIKEDLPTGAGFGAATLSVSDLVRLQRGLYTGKFVDFTLTWKTSG